MTLWCIKCQDFKGLWISHSSATVHALILVAPASSKRLSMMGGSNLAGAISVRLGAGIHLASIFNSWNSWGQQPSKSQGSQQPAKKRQTFVCSGVSVGPRRDTTFLSPTPHGTVPSSHCLLFPKLTLFHHVPSTLGAKLINGVNKVYRWKDTKTWVPDILLGWKLSAGNKKSTSRKWGEGKPAIRKK